MSSLSSPNIDSPPLARYQGEVILENSVYGRIEVTEPVLTSLISTDAMQRLKKISQPGYFEPFFPGTDHSRFDHSVGVCHLLGKYGARLEEQIAGLLHDVSHTAFSHCVDYALDSGSETEQNFQDNSFLEYVSGTDIPKILASFGFDANYIFDSSHFPLCETELPDLCADRIDYILRSGVHCSEIDRRQVEEIFDRLEVKDDQWGFKDSDSALSFARYFSHINSKYYCGLESAIMFRSVGDALKHLLKQKYITQNQLFETDEWVLEQINNHSNHDSELKRLVKRMNNRSKVVNDENNFQAKISCKSRAVDPLVFDKGQKQRLSEIHREWEDTLVREMKPKTYFLRFDDVSI